MGRSDLPATRFGIHPTAAGSTLQASQNLKYVPVPFFRETEMPDGSQLKVAFVFNQQRSKALEEAEFDTPEVIDAITTALRKQYEVIQIEMTRTAPGSESWKTVSPTSF